MAAELRSRGHDVRVLSRSSPEYRVDLTTGEGLAEALAGCDAVVDASNSQSSAKQAARTLVEGSRRLLAAEEAAGVGHHVCVSIVGCDQLPMGYFKVKADQEAVVEHGPVPWTVVRATQFHELMDMAFTAGARELHLAQVNGAPGLVVHDADGLLSVVAFTVDTDRITAVDIVRNPDKLTAVRDSDDG